MLSLSRLPAAGRAAAVQARPTAPDFKSKTVKTSVPFSFKADGSSAWLSVGKDSGFEGFSSIFVQKIAVELSEVVSSRGG